MGSKRFRIDVQDLLDLGKKALLVGVAASLTYASDNITHVDLGMYSALVVPVVASGIDFLIKLVKDNTK